MDEPDTVIQRSRDFIEADSQALGTFRSVRSLLALVFSSRSPNPSARLASRYEINVSEFPSSDDFQAIFTKEATPASQAALETVQQVIQRQPASSLFETYDSWAAWRAHDGSAFCDLARSFYSKYLRNVLFEVVGNPMPELKTFAHEASIITRTFSARWFNACARHEEPDDNNIRWYIRHCAGKLDLELERELSDWDENAWRHRRTSLQMKLEVDRTI